MVAVGLKNSDSISEKNLGTTAAQRSHYRHSFKNLGSAADQDSLLNNGFQDLGEVQYW